MTENKPFKFKFFLSDARLLSEEEVNRLPADTIRSAQAEGKTGIWLEITCPDSSCLDDEGRITLPTPQSRQKGYFLNLFCPEGSCEMLESTDVP